MARTVRTKVYKFTELSDDAKQKAFEWYRSLNHSDGYAWESENHDSLKEFCKIFPCETNRRGDGLRFTGTDNQENLTGQRLATYIWNNYISGLLSGKFYSLRLKSRHSKCQFEISCPFTGYYMDEVLLDPFIDFIKKPNTKTTLEDLINDSYSAWERGIEKDREFQDSDEYITEAIEANEYEFTKDGRRF